MSKSWPRSRVGIFGYQRMRCFKSRQPLFFFQPHMKLDRMQSKRWQLKRFFDHEEKNFFKKKTKARVNFLFSCMWVLALFDCCHLGIQWSEYYIIEAMAAITLTKSPPEEKRHLLSVTKKMKFPQVEIYHKLLKKDSGRKCKYITPLNRIITFDKYLYKHK